MGPWALGAPPSSVLRAPSSGTAPGRGCPLGWHASRQPGWRAKPLFPGPGSVSVTLLMLGLRRVSPLRPPLSLSQQRKEESEL